MLEKSLTPLQVVAEAIDEERMMYGRDEDNAATILAALSDAGYAVVPVKLTAAMLAASKGAMKDYIGRQPPELRPKLGRRHGVDDATKYQIRWEAAVKASPR